MTTTDTTVRPFTMPSLGADMDEGSIIEWLVGVGDRVERGQVIVRVETEKSDIDVEIWHDGVVDEILVGPDRFVPVGTVLMRFRPDGAPAGPAESDDRDPTELRVVAAPPDPEAEEIADVVPAAQRRSSPLVERSGHVVWASPLARRLAGERGIALQDVQGSGPGGAIRSVDLPMPDRSLAGVEQPEEPTAGGSGHDTNDDAGPRRQSRADRMRSMIATRMSHSNAEIPHYRLQQEIDLAPLLDHLEAINVERPISDRIVPAAALVRAVALAAERHSELNGIWSDGSFRPGPGVNVSVAISLRHGGLVTPTMRHADEMTLDETMITLREITTDARRGAVRARWTSVTSTITVTNLGDRGADLVHGLISPPEVALVGFGRIAERPIVVDGAVVARPTVIATLAADHRATDGATGSRFLTTLAHHLTHPEEL